jgi:hypothetical protein
LDLLQAAAAVVVVGSSSLPASLTTTTMAEHEHRTLAPPNLTSGADAHTPIETLRLTEQAGLAKARLSLVDLSIKSFLGGIFISLGAAFDLVVAGGSPGLRASNPALATMLSGFVFPIGFVIIILMNLELCTSNMFVMVCYVFYLSLVHYLPFIALTTMRLSIQN